MENEKTENNKIAESVLKKIEIGEVKMKSRRYFLFKVGLLLALIFLTFLTSVTLVSYLLFSLKTGGYLFLLGFGTKGIYKFLLVLPWFLLCFNALLLFFLDYLLKRFRFGYNSPLIYLFLGTLFLVTIFSYLINFTSIHRAVMHRAMEERLPIGNHFYKNIRMSHKNKGIIRGEVVSIGEDFITIRHMKYDRDGGLEEKIFIQNGANLDSFIEIGDEVFIAGDIASGTQMSAYGVRRILRE